MITNKSAHMNSRNKLIVAIICILSLGLLVFAVVSTMNSGNVSPDDSHAGAVPKNVAKSKNPTPAKATPKNTSTAGKTVAPIKTAIPIKTVISQKTTIPVKVSTPVKTAVPKQ